MLVALTEGVGIGYLASNFATLVVLVILRFALADTWIWAGSGVAVEAPGARAR
jgi:putative flippase GtrA